MRRSIVFVFALLSLSAFAACGGETAPEIPPCDLDATNLDTLHGEWISLTGGGGGADVPDKFARAKFHSVDGEQQVVYTAGRLAPGMPQTNKYDYKFTGMDPRGDAIFSKNMFPGKSKQRIARLRKDNRNLAVKFEGRMYVKVDKVNCVLVISDMYVTYVRGEEKMDSNPAGTRTYLQLGPKEPPLSWVHCDEPRQLVPFATEEVNWKKDRALDPKKGVFAGEPVWLHYASKLYEGKDAREKFTADAVFATDGATYDYELWVGDIGVGGKQKIAVEPDAANDGRLAWKLEHAFDRSYADGVYVELHRYMTKDGQRELVHNACTVLWPEPERTEDEKKAAEEEAKKR
jgi:hypothetical protein